MMNEWWSCGMSRIAQQGEGFAEWAFGAHTVDQEVKMNCRHGDRRETNKMRLTHSPLLSSLLFVQFLSHSLRFTVTLCVHQAEQLQ